MFWGVLFVFCLSFCLSPSQFLSVFIYTKTYLSAQTLISGSQANAGAGTLNHHTFTKYADALNRSLLVTNVNTISYGRDRETDDNFKYRIQKDRIL